MSEHIALLKAMGVRLHYLVLHNAGRRTWMHMHVPFLCTYLMFERPYDDSYTLNIDTVVTKL